jgi:hypothetical protein
MRSYAARILKRYSVAFGVGFRRGLSTNEYQN